MGQKGFLYLNLAQLSRCKLFERIPVHDIPSAIKCLGGFSKSFSNGESLYPPSADNLLPGLVLSGIIHIHQIFSDGSTVLLKEAEPGELFGVAMSFSPDDNIFVSSSGNSSVLFLHLPSRNSLNSCSCKYKMIILENLIYILAENNKILNKKIQILSRHTLREKLSLFLSNQQALQKTNILKLNMSREKIAQYINADRSAVSRELNKMQKDGLIKIQNKSIAVINLG